MNVPELYLDLFDGVDEDIRRLKVSNFPSDAHEGWESNRLDVELMVGCAKGDLSHDAAGNLLTEWPYTKATRPKDATDDWAPPPSTCQDMEDACDRQLIPADMYAQIRELARREAPRA